MNIFNSEKTQTILSIGIFFFFDKSAFCKYQLTSPPLPSFIKKHIACNSQGHPHFRSHIFSNTTEYPGLLVKYEFSFHWWEKWSNREENKQIQSKDRARSFNLNSPLLEYVITFSLSFVQPTPSTQICPLTWYFSFYHMPFKPQEQIRHKFLKHEFSTHKCLQNAHITNSIWFWILQQWKSKISDFTMYKLMNISNSLLHFLLYMCLYIYISWEV